MLSTSGELGVNSHSLFSQLFKWVTQISQPLAASSLQGLSLPLASTENKSKTRSKLYLYSNYPLSQNNLNKITELALKPTHLYPNLIMQLINQFKINENNEDSNTDKSLSNELEKLNDLYKSGALTKEEFEKAKTKILEN